MTEYRVVFARSARKDLERLRPPTATRVFAAIEALAAQPRPDGCKKLAGGRGYWRVRVGEYRVVYGVNDDAQTVDIVTVRHRRDVYR